MPLTHFGLTILADAATGTANLVSDFNSFTFDDAWFKLGNLQNHAFQAAVAYASILGGICITGQTVIMVFTISKDEFLSHVNIKIITWLLIVSMLLPISNGRLLARTNLAIRNVIINISDGILDYTADGISYRQRIRDENLMTAFETMLASQVGDCQTIPESELDEEGKSKREVCVDNAFEKVRNLANEYKKQNQDSYFNLDLTKLYTSLINPFINAVVVSMLTVFQVAFSFTLEMCFLMQAEISPFPVALSLIPGGMKVMQAWFSGWVALGLLRISYTFVIAMTASTIANIEDKNIILMPLMQGIISPALAMIFASGGGIATFKALSSAGSNAGGSALKFATKILLPMLMGGGKK